MHAGRRTIAARRNIPFVRCFSHSFPSLATVLTVGVSPICKRTIESRQHAVVQVPLQHRSEALAVIHRCEGLVDSSPNFMFAMTEGFSKAGARLKVIGVPAGKKIDQPYVEAATKRGILIVRNYDNGEMSKESLLMQHIAEHATGGKDFRGTELSGRTIGFLGVGLTALNVAIWCRSFGMKTIGHDGVLSGKSITHKGLVPTALSDLLPASDFIVIDSPLVGSTLRLVDTKLLQQCRPGVHIINSAHADVVDETALLQALQSGHVHSASLDLHQVASPDRAAGALRSHPRARVAKIPGSATFDVQEDFYRQFDANIFGSDTIAEAREAAQNVCDVLDGMGSAAIINAPDLGDAADAKEYLPYLSLAEDLGAGASVILNDNCKLTSLTIAVRGERLSTDYPLAYAVRAAVLRAVLRAAGFPTDLSLQDAVDTATAMGLRAHLHRESSLRSGDAAGADVISVHLQAHASTDAAGSVTDSSRQASPRLRWREATLGGNVFSGKTGLITVTEMKDHY